MADALISSKPTPVYKCAKCNGGFAKSDVQVDHSTAIGTNSPNTIDEFVMAFTKMHKTPLDVLCIVCHKEKTKRDVWVAKLNGMGGQCGCYDTIDQIKARYQWHKRSVKNDEPG
jgi:hypothetical protein